MTAPPAPADPPPEATAEVAAGGPRGWTWPRALAALVVVAMVAFWLYVLLLAPAPGPPDQLDSSAFPEEAEAVCAGAMAALAEVPSAREAATPEERAVTLAAANDVLAEMVEELRAVAPSDGRDGRLVGRWLDDWEVYLGDREEYEAELAAGEDVAFTVTARDSDQITEPIDGFAEANEMDSCQTPLDV